VQKRCHVTGIGNSLLRWVVAGIMAGGVLLLGAWRGWTGVIACAVASVILSWGLAWVMGERFSFKLLRFHEPE
jgi:hypothetical protein